MAEFYFDPSAIGNEYQAYAATPTWGAGATDKPLPMDGNGDAGPGHSAAVAIAEIQITVLPADGNTLTIAGAVLTAKTTAAAKNQWTISGAISTCVTNLVALINTFGTGTAQCDAAVNSGSCALLLALPYWQFARVKPGTTDTIQIATRIAGANLNHATNSNVAISSSGWGTPPTLTQFAGGANGPFAYFVNDTTVFGKTQGNYGLALAAAPGPSEPSITTDVIHGRTRRSGADLSTTITASSTWSVTWKERNWLFDNGTVWSGDNGRYTFSHKNTNSGTSAHAYSLPSGGKAVFESRGDGNFQMEGAVTSGSSSGTINFAQVGSNSCRIALIRSRFVEGADNQSGRRISLLDDQGAGRTGLAADLSGSYVEYRGTVKNLINLSGGGSPGAKLKFNGMNVAVVAATGAIGSFIQATGAAAELNQIEWIGGSVYDTNGVYKCVNPINVTNTQTSTDILIDSVVGVTDPSVGWTASLTSSSRLAWNQPEGPNKGYRLETNQVSTDWKGDGTFPYTTASDLRGNPWSHRVTWTAIPDAYNVITPVMLRHFYRSAAAAKVITVDLYVPDATTFYLDELQMIANYIDSSDVVRTEFVGGARGARFGTRTALSAGSATWTPNGVASHSGKKISLTTSQPIKEGSEVVITLGLCASRSPSVTFYVSPEPILTTP